MRVTLVSMHLYRISTSEPPSAKITPTAKLVAGEILFPVFSVEPNLDRRPLAQGDRFNGETMVGGAI
jgi:hypothetical protein